MDKEERLARLARFFTMVAVKDRFECWEWTGNKPDGRYGHFAVRGKAVKAHRWLYETVCGPIPEGMVIRHKCDNPSCVNPAHLTIGTHQDNIDDRVVRGRGADRKGEKHPLAKIGEAEVREIRRARDLGESQASVAARFGISGQHVGKIFRRESWGHI